MRLTPDVSLHSAHYADAARVLFAVPRRGQHPVAAREDLETVDGRAGFSSLELDRHRVKREWAVCQLAVRREAVATPVLPVARMLEQ